VNQHKPNQLFQRTGLNEGPYLGVVRCEGVLVGGKRCRRTKGVEACYCGCSLDLCPRCMSGQMAPRIDEKAVQP